MTSYHVPGVDGDISNSDIYDAGITLVAVLYWSMILYYAWTQAMTRPQYGALFVGGGIVTYIVIEAKEPIANRNYLRLVAYAFCLVISVYTAAHVFLNFNDLIYLRTGWAYQHEYVMGGLFTLAVIYLTYDAFGISFVSVLIAALLYGYFGQEFPGVFTHGGFTIERTINILVLEFNGFFGSIVRIIAAMVALFLLYAGLMQAYGAFELVSRGSTRLVDYIRSGVAQTAVVSSMVMGSINGAATANAAMTGSFTIPLMKESGIRSKTAGAIEAVASSGGQIMPPIMGASAFIMASFLGISYIDVVIAGLLPAFIFYASVVVAVHYSTVNQITDQSRIDVETKSIKQLGYESLKFLIPFLGLIYMLGIAQWTILSSALYTSILMAVCGIVFPVIKTAAFDGANVASKAVEMLWDTIEGFRIGAETLAPIVIIIIAVNGIVTLFETSGMPSALSLSLIQLSGGVLVIAAVLAMIACIILGLGMPTSAAYVLVALLIAPSLIENFQIAELSVHYFVFYSAILSALTPPIAIAVVVTTGIADSPFWDTAIEAIKIAFPLFVLPFAFLYNPELITGGITPATLLSGSLAFGGALAISYGLNKRLPRIGRIETYGYRALFTTLGILAIAYPGMVARMGLLAVLTGTFFLFHYRHGELIDVMPD